jgi:hypothetical protein
MRFTGMHTNTVFMYSILGSLSRPERIAGRPHHTSALICWGLRKLSDERSASQSLGSYLCLSASRFSGHICDSFQALLPYSSPHAMTPQVCSGKLE